MKGVLYPETRYNSSNLISRSTGNIHLIVELGYLFTKDCDTRLASAYIIIAKKRTIDTTKTASVNLRNIENFLATRNLV